MEEKRTILAVGKLPPPLGGVTVFFERWIAAQRSKGHVVRVMDVSDLRAFRLFRLFALFGRTDAVLVNSLNATAIILLRILHPCSHLTVVDHNESRHRRHDGVARRWLRHIAYSTVQQIEVVSDHLVRNHPGYEQKVRVVPSFFPPDGSRYEDLTKAYSSRVREFAETVRGPKLLISAWRPVVEDGRDLYGLLTAIRLLEAILVEEPDARLIVFVAEPVDNVLWREVKDAVKSLPPERIIIETGQKELWPLLKHVDVVLRLTSTDGNSVSIHEALWAGCRVVASDVVPRPPGTYTYRYGDDSSLLKTTIRALRANGETR